MQKNCSNPDQPVILVWFELNILYTCSQNVVESVYAYMSQAKQNDIFRHAWTLKIQISQWSYTVWPRFNWGLDSAGICLSLTLIIALIWVQIPSLACPRHGSGHPSEVNVFVFLLLFFFAEYSSFFIHQPVANVFLLTLVMLNNLRCHTHF